MNGQVLNESEGVMDNEIGEGYKDEMSSTVQG